MCVCEFLYVAYVRACVFVCVHLLLISSSIVFTPPPIVLPITRSLFPLPPSVVLRWSWQRPQWRLSSVSTTLTTTLSSPAPCCRTTAHPSGVLLLLQGTERVLQRNTSYHMQILSPCVQHQRTSSLLRWLSFSSTTTASVCALSAGRCGATGQHSACRSIPSAARPVRARLTTP
jgi:hypothetical protein